jgi:Zn-dependent M28 family amino/carboxypeptidase
MRNLSALLGPVLLGSLLGSACASEPSAPPAADGPGPTPSVSRTPIGELPEIDVDALMAHTRVLSSDQFEGRAPGSKGEELTVAYLIDQFQKMGLKPGNPDGTFIQKVPLVGITPTPAPLVLRKGTEERTLAWRDDVVAWTKHVAPSASIADSAVVFVGYGVVAPEFNWDDYKGLDVKGKTLVMLVNDPPVLDSTNQGELDAKTFGGLAMTYYGRWTYKYEIAASKGAAGVLIVHETGPAGYPFDVVQSKVTEQFDLVTPDKNMGRPAIEAWITLDQARALLTMGGQDFDTLKVQAATREFQPVSLGVTASMTIKNTLRNVDSKNVVARMIGSDPAFRDEYVGYIAHWDHLGVGPAVNGDTIYNGAKDNAVGTAGLLEIARAFTRLPAAPRRSVLFLAVTAEEQGLLGSQYYAVTPLYPLAKTAAVINMDAINVNGRTRDLTLVGYGASDLDDYAKDAAGEQGRIIRPDPEPDKGYYYRSDHFNFAKAGVPAMYADEGTEFIGKPEGFGERVRSEYTNRDYHAPSDVVTADWDLSGSREDLKLFFAVGYRVAEAAKLPEWKPGTEFRAIREKMLQRP